VSAHTCPFCGAAVKNPPSSGVPVFECRTLIGARGRDGQTQKCVKAEVARMTRERDKALERAERLEIAGDAMAADPATMADLVEAWEAAKEATP